MSYINRYEVRAILDSKDKSFNLSKFSRKDLEFICNICISEYRHIRGLYVIMQDLNKKK